MSQIPLPKPIELQQILAMMYGGGLKAEAGEPVPVAPGSQSLVALYVSDDDEPLAIGAADYAFTAYAGASLTRIPKGTADDCAKTGDFSEIMLGNVHEIMNICSRLLMDSSSPHLRLNGLFGKPDELPDNVKELLGGTSRGGDYSVTFPGYGSGGISFYDLAA